MASKRLSFLQKCKHSEVRQSLCFLYHSEHLKMIGHVINILRITKSGFETTWFFRELLKRSCVSSAATTSYSVGELTATGCVSAGRRIFLFISQRPRAAALSGRQRTCGGLLLAKGLVGFFGNETCQLPRTRNIKRSAASKQVYTCDKSYLFAVMFNANLYWFYIILVSSIKLQ